MFLTIIIAFFSLIALVVIHELGHFTLAKMFGVKVEEFGLGYPPRLIGKKFGETLYSINLLPFGAFVRIHGEEGGVEDYQSFVGKSIWQRVLIVLGGVAAFWIIATVLFIIVFSIGAEIPINDEVNLNFDAKVRIVDVAANSPASIAGLKTGDTIINLKFQSDSRQISKVKDVQDFVSSYKGKEITLTIQRQNKVFDVSLTPRVSYPEGEGSMGVGLERTATIIKKQFWYQAPLKGIIYCGKMTGEVIKGIVSIFFSLFKGRGLPVGAEPAGIVGITIFLARAVEFGAGFFLYFVANIAIFVAIFNLLPIPALDGGKLVFLFIEKIREKAVSPKIEQSITMAFFALLILFAIFVTIKFDIPRLSDFIKSEL